MGHGDGQNAAGQMPVSGQGAHPYPPAQQHAGGVTAPGGYPVYSPGAGPSGGHAPQPTAYPPQPQTHPYPPQPQPGAMEPPTKPAGYGPAPSGYPGTMPTGAPYPPAGPTGYPPHAGPSGYPPAAAGAAPGYPVMGTPAPAPMGGMSVEQGGVPPGKEPCGCSAGWVLFAVGFLFWPCWVAAAFIPLCTKSRNDRMAAIASTICMLILAIIGIALGVSSSRWRAY